jgi:hypothetical protein
VSSRALASAKPSIKAIMELSNRSELVLCSKSKRKGRGSPKGQHEFLSETVMELIISKKYGK